MTDLSPETLQATLRELHEELMRRQSSDIRTMRSRWDSIVAAVRAGEAIPPEVAALWEKGDAWQVILDEGQLAWTALWDGTEDSLYNGSGRQRGKSMWALSIIDTACRKWSGVRTRWTGLTIDTARAIVAQAGEDYWLTCPESLRPVKKSDDYLYANGSKLFVCGTDAQTFRRARGMARIAIDVRDECGFYQEFASVDSALSPGTQVPGPSGKAGRVLYSSTPADTPGHESNYILRVHQARGAYICETFHENPRVDPETVIQRELASKGGTREQLLASSKFRREFGGELILEETKAAVPRWELMRGPVPTEHQLVRVLERPQHFDAYVALDIGGHVDPHMVLFAWFDPALQHLYVEDEMELPSAKYTVPEFADAIKERESKLYGENGWDGTLAGADEWRKQFGKLPEYLRDAVSKKSRKNPYLRVGDNDNLVLNTLRGYGIAVVPSQKHDKALHVDALNDRIGRGQFIVHPRCTRLLTQLSTTTWNKARTSWERTAMDHGDGIDCAVFLERNVFWHRDCRPKTWRDPWLSDGTQTPHEKRKSALLRLIRR